MRSAAAALTLTLALTASVLLAGCTGDDSRLPDNGQSGLFDRAAGVDVVVRNDGITSRGNVTIEIVNPSGDIAQSGELDVPPNAERGIQGTVHEEGSVRVVVTAQDYGGGKAEGTGNPWQCPGGARLTYTFVLPADPTGEPEFRESHCGA